MKEKLCKPSLLHDLFHWKTDIKWRINAFIESNETAVGRYSSALLDEKIISFVSDTFSYKNNLR